MPSVRGVGRCSALILTLLSTVAATAYAADCDINVYQAYETAKVRGWSFYCPWSLPGGKNTFMPFGDTIGCVIDTPAVSWPSTANPSLRFFVNSGTSDKMKNGWSLKSYEITGAQWTILGFDGNYVRATFHQLQPAKKYQVKVSRMTLSKSGGTCSKAISEAF
jgi:hypothetical protein